MIDTGMVLQMQDDIESSSFTPFRRQQLRFHTSPQLRSLYKPKLESSKPFCNNYATQNIQQRHKTLNPQRPVNPTSSYKYSTFSACGSSNRIQNTHNQDSFLAYQNQAHTILGIFDGNGTNGHLVSEFLKQEFLSAFSSSEKITQEYIHKVFLSINNQLFSQTNFNISLSGSTAVLLIADGAQLTIANVGDSRAVIAKEENNSLLAIPLNKIHSLDIVEEKERIVSRGGRVDYDRDEDNGPLRVWCKYDRTPGLAMSRVFGHRIASQLGVIAAPDVNRVNIDYSYKFVILGSDGFWDMIKDYEAVEIVKREINQGRSTNAAETLVAEASQKWMKKQATDDITAVVLILNNI